MCYLITALFLAALVAVSRKDWQTVRWAGNALAYLVIGALALAHVAKTDEEQSKGQTPPGNVIVEMFWDKAIDADVDLWVQAPGDVPVGYSNKSGVIFNLVRDDLGKGSDPNSM